MCDCIERIKEKIDTQYDKKIYIKPEVRVGFYIRTWVRRRKKRSYPVEYEEGWSKRGHLHSYRFNFCPFCGGPWAIDKAKGAPANGS